MQQVNELVCVLFVPVAGQVCLPLVLPLQQGWSAMPKGTISKIPKQTQSYNRQLTSDELETFREISGRNTYSKDHKGVARLYQVANCVKSTRERLQRKRLLTVLEKRRSSSDNKENVPPPGST